MPKIKANGITMNYEQQGAGDPLILIPHLAADHACFAFQVAEYSKHFTCISVDLRGSGESDKPAGDYSTELFADDVAALMQGLGIAKVHVAGFSLGAATAMWLAAKYPDKVNSLSVHSGWPKSDHYLKAVVEGWELVARALNSVPETLVLCVFPWCLTPELYAAKPDYVQSLASFVRSRPPQPLGAFLQHTGAVIAHDASAHLSQITAPTQITFGRHDTVTSTRFADQMTSSIRRSELVIFEDCSHTPFYQNVEEFNRRTLEFLQRRAAQATLRQGAA